MGKNIFVTILVWTEVCMRNFRMNLFVGMPEVHKIMFMMDKVRWTKLRMQNFVN